MPLDIFCNAGNAVSSVASGALNSIGEAITEAVGNVVVSLGTMWVQIGTPQLAGGSVSEWLRSELAFYTGMLALVATAIGAGKMALERKAQPGKDLAKALVTLAVVNSASLAGIAALVTAFDAFSIYIIDQSVEGTDFGSNITGMLAFSSISGLGVIVVILLGVVALFATLAQLILMIARGGLLVIMTGVLPLASSFTNTAAGRAWFQKAIAWTVAAILYKPVAAIVYAVAFRLTGQDVFGTDGLTSVLTGLMLMLMALFALPALMRLAVPLVAATATSGGGGSGTGAAATGAVVATGAQVVQMRGGGSGGGSGSGGGPGAPGPSGAGVAGPRGPSGAGGGAGAAGAAGAGPSGAGAAGAGASAAGAAGPAGLAVSAGVQTAQIASGAVRNTATQATEPGGATQ